MTTLKPAILTLLSAIAVITSCFTNATIKLSMPIDCIYGKNCFIQNYYDLGSDATRAYKDYKCGSATYKAHNGVDFRILDYVQLKKNVEVLAAADGTVKALRNNEPEFIFYHNKKIAELNSKECGNGVVITHADNYETQYCHLKKNSIVVKGNQKVKAGDLIGIVGMSGATEFPHLHLSLRKNNINIDPFSNQSLKSININYNCNNNTDSSLWDEKTKKILAYKPTAILNFHATDQQPKEDNARFGGCRSDSIDHQSDKIILWADIINIQKNDQVIFNIKDGQNQEVFNNTIVLNKRYAQYFIYSGKKLDNLKLKNTQYTANIFIIRNEKIVDSKKIIILKNSLPSES